MPLVKNYGKEKFKEERERMFKEKGSKLESECSGLEPLFERLSYFKNHPEEKTRNKEEFYSLCVSVYQHYNPYLSQVEELLENDNILNEESYFYFRETVNPVFHFDDTIFQGLWTRINSIIENQNLNKLSYFCRWIRHRPHILKEKLKDKSLSKEEKEKLEEELNEVEERLYFLTR